MNAGDAAVPLARNPQMTRGQLILDLILEVNCDAANTRLQPDMSGEFEIASDLRIGREYQVHTVLSSAEKWKSYAFGHFGVPASPCLQFER